MLMVVILLRLAAASHGRVRRWTHASHLGCLCCNLTRVSRPTVGWRSLAATWRHDLSTGGSQHSRARGRCQVLTNWRLHS